MQGREESQCLALFVRSQFVSLFVACRDMVYAGWGTASKGTCCVVYWLLTVVGLSKPHNRVLKRFCLAVIDNRRRHSSKAPVEKVSGYSWGPDWYRPMLTC